MKQKESEAGLVLLALLLMMLGTIAVAVFFYSVETHTAYVDEEALTPLRPRFVKTTIEYRPITPNDRVAYGHSVLGAPTHALPPEITMGRSYAAAEPSKR